MLFAVLNPADIATCGLASSAFARHYSRNLFWFLFLPLLRCFSSGSSPRVPIDSVHDTWFFIMCVPTFGYPRIYAYMQLPAAFRSLSRPSSAPNAKAFSICSCSLELPFLDFRLGGSLALCLNCYDNLHFQWIVLSVSPAKIVSLLPAYILSEKPDSS